MKGITWLWKESVCGWIQENDTQSNKGIAYMKNTAAEKYTAVKATKWMAALSSSQAYHSPAVGLISGPNPKSYSRPAKTNSQKDSILQTKIPWPSERPVCLQILQEP